MRERYRAGAGAAEMTTPAERKADRFPIVIAEWPRNYRELVRVALGRFHDRFTVEIRTWWRDADGVFKPSRAGLTLAIKHLPKLAAAINKALQRAEVLGLTEPVANNRSKKTGDIDDG